MFPGEMVILMAIAVNKAASKKLLNQPMDVTGEYISYLYDSLVRRGYIKCSTLKGYQLTAMGKEALLGFLYKNKGRTKDTIKRVQQLGTECSQDAVILIKETARVK